MSRETVRSATWKPSFSSSPWILGAPQRGLAAVIRVTRAAISGLTGGRPRVGRPESLVQCSRNRRRCHRRIVSGVTPPGVDGCGSTYIDCLARCIEGGDPLNILGKGLLSAFGATLPKWMYGLPRGLGGAQPFTTPPSAALTLGARMEGAFGPVAVSASVRTVASVYSGAWIGYGVYLFGRELYCVQQCYTDACLH